MNPPSVNISKNIIGSPAMEWVMNHWVWVLLGVILLLILLFLVIIPGIFSLIRKSRKIAETQDLKKDLMVWKNLKALVQGGDKTRDAKKELSLHLQNIRMMLKQGLSLLAQSRKKKYDVPWFMILGEPQGGKSELLKKSSLDLFCSANQESSASAALPLNCWIGPKAFVLDVSGRIFFDRWLEGSSAEWDYLIKLLKKHHHRRPLDGIILTLPADALIADDPELTKQKAALIGSELNQLLNSCGMNLPCHVVVTKMDMLLGFREYFSNFDEEERHNIFGWANHTKDGIFDEADFKDYLEGLTEKIRNGSMALMLNKELFQQKSSAERMAVTGKSYLFAESLSQLRSNLCLYLAQIFGDESWNGHEQSILSGVFFTSAQDNGVVLSPGFAETAGKALEEAVILSREQKKNQSSFIRNLLKDLVFSCKIPASFTAKERFKRQIPGYVVCLFLAAAGALWLISAMTQSEALKERLQPTASYYNTLADNFTKKNIDKSPLVAMDKKGVPQLLNDWEMIGYPQYTRLQFFYDAHSRAFENIVLHFGFKLSNLLQFGLHFNPAYYQRQYIFNMIQARMSFLPTVRTLQALLLAQDDNVAFTRNKREALFDFAEIAFSWNPQYRTWLELDAMLLYLLPGSNPETINLLASYQDKIVRNNQDVLAQIIYQYDFSQAQQKAFDHFFKSWKDLSIYPETMYPLVRNLIRDSHKYSKNQEQIAQLSMYASGSAQNQSKAIALWDKFQLEQQKLEGRIQTSIEKLSSYPELSSLIRMGTAKAITPRIHPAKSLLQTAAEDYRKLLKTDQKEVREYIAEGRQLLAGRGREVFFKTGQEAADNYFAVAEKKLHTEISALNKKVSFLRQKNLFTQIRSNPPKEVEAADSPDKILYHIYVRLNKLVSTLPANADLKRFEDFSKQWKKNNDELKSITFRLKDLRKQYENVPDVLRVIDDYSKLVTLKGNHNRNRLIASLMQFYPKAEAELLLLMGKLKNTGTVSDPIHIISRELARESIGQLNIPLQYEPGTAHMLFTPWNEIRQFEAQEAKNPAGTQFHVQIEPEIKTTLAAYLDNYLKFWGSYPNTLAPPMNTWEQFQTFCRKMKPYEVNSLLLAVYNSCAENLTAVPASLLSASQKKYRETLLADINAKTQMLTPHFSGICIRQVNSWSLLPRKPEEAYQFIHSRNDKELLTDYLALIATGNKGDIPWWSNFFRNGIALLRNEAGSQIFEKLNQADSTIFRFPLCRDAALENEFRESELLAAWETLKMLNQNMTFEKGSVKNTKDANKALSMFHTLDVSSILDKKDYQWLDNILLITDALVNRNKPLVWTLTIPDMKQQKKLNDAFAGNIPLAVYRYRYLAVSSGGESPLLGRQALNSSVTIKGRANDKDLRFDFFANSSENTPAGTLKFAGNWSIIRLYLTKGSYYEVEKKTHYVPLHIRDRFDASSILWVGLTFNQTLPRAENWPSSENWPDFSNIQKISKSQAISSWNLIKLIKESNSYESLMKKLEGKVFSNPVVFEIQLDGASSKRFLARYRYGEVLLPGQPAKRIALRPDTLLATCSFSTPEIEFRFYEFAGNKKPACQFRISAPCAPLKLVMTPGKIPVGQTSFKVPCTVKGEKLVFKVNIE